MILRRPKESDVPAIMELAKRYDWPLPTSFGHAMIVERKNRIVAFGMVRPILEGIILVNERKKDAAVAVRELIAQGKFDAIQLGYNEIYAFVKDDSFGKILENHFSFEDTRGKMLILRIDAHGKQTS